MFVDDSIVLQYLEDKNLDEVSNNWIFSNIEEDKYIFEKPDTAKKYEVKEILITFNKILSEFIPLNTKLYTDLFPEWTVITKDMNILLVVGCPSPYDAMIRKHEGKEYLIFDLIRFYDYKVRGYDIDTLIRQMLTHETAHLCLHTEYPVPVSENYLEQLKYITFDEGFAHLLAFKDNINCFDFSDIINRHYNEALIKLMAALSEEDEYKQKVLLEQANSGAYWDKYACICGKLFLADNLEHIKKIYKAGIDKFISSIISHYTKEMEV